MSHLWTASDFSDAVEPISQPGEIGNVDGVSIDSRSIGKGDAFFAIKGDRFDGHAFARSALEEGAAVVVLEEAQKSDFADLSERVVFVDDVLKALERLGRAARKRAKGKIIAVTGSVGKTSTKDALRKALEPSGKVHAAVASFNNHWGVPLTLARMHVDSDYGVFEVGMNHSGEIRTLIDMVRPDIAIVTTVVAAHIGNFDSIDEIAAAKAEIFEGVVPGGAALVNGDNEFGDYLAKQAGICGIENIYHFGSKAEFDAKLLKADLRADGSDLSISLFGEQYQVHLAAPGAHLAQNSLSVLAAVHLAGASVPAAIAVLGRHGATKGRGERHDLSVDGGTALLIDESYNANPSSVSAALETLGLGSAKADGRRIAVLGDMLELGGEAAELHIGLKEVLVDAGLDKAYLCGPMMHHLWECLPKDMQAGYGERSEDLIALLKEDLQPGDMVMIKGSLGSRMGVIVASLLESYKN
jgi:UDP-N-acetylmuramoyl-tripeptide--D-alanyl-D-alanine ligase